MTTQSLSAAQKYVKENGGTYSKNGKLYVCTAAVEVETGEGEDEPSDFYNEEMEGGMSAISVDSVSAIMLNIFGLSDSDETVDFNVVTIHDLADQLSSKRGINTLEELREAIDTELEEPTPAHSPLPNEDLEELDTPAPINTEDYSETPDDDLTQIKGIGAATAEKLKGLGIHNFQQLADLTPSQSARLNEELNAIGNKAQKWSELAASLIK